MTMDWKTHHKDVHSPQNDTDSVQSNQNPSRVFVQRDNRTLNFTRKGKGTKEPEQSQPF